MNTLEIIFFILLSIVFYTYIGYGIILWILVRIKRIFIKEKSYHTMEELPEVTLFITAYNEEQVVEKKMQNCRELVIAGRKASELLPEWKEKRDKAGNDIQIQEKLKAELQNESRQRCEKIQEELTIVSNDLKKAVLKEKEYEEHHIQDVLERSAK